MGPMFTPLRVPGHTLRAEGKPVSGVNRYYDNGANVGRGMCSCGWVSDAVETDAARKRAHRAHKADVLRAT